jgi:hypothetical protein
MQRLGDRFRNGHCPRRGSATGSAADGGAGSSTTSYIDEQAGRGVGHSIEGSLHRWQQPEPLATLVVAEAQFQDNAPLMQMPVPVRDAVRESGLQQRLSVGIAPQRRGGGAVEDLDGEPVGHL